MLISHKIQAKQTKPIPFVFSKAFGGPFQVYQLQLASPSLSCSIDLLVLWLGPSICLSFGFLLFSLCGLLERQTWLDGKFLSFSSCLLTLGLAFCLGLGDLFVYQNLRDFFCCSFYRTDTDLCISLCCMVKYQFLAQFPILISFPPQSQSGLGL